ncbi:cell division control protein 48 homolog C-like isoform X2 [Salvia miltiorrhiza]|uniref:cell division control protein 48 homolog C-like isoform X2 n=1 Tax=Salvia miltiorrhiza TaxID=226208 RepID=UPI0025AD1692|nr:cell division control protein 48 homolog C-like isoform X2 [Salvia miltiorrhiza]
MATALLPWEERALRSHLECVSAGKKNLSHDQLVDLLLFALPHTYSRLNRNLLTQRVAKIIPLPCRRQDAIDEPTPVSNKRPKIGDPRTVNSQNEVSAYSSAEVDSSGSGGRINRSDELGDGWRGVSEKHNRPMFRDFWGMSSVIHELQRKVVAPLHQFKLLRHLGVEPATRILLHGPPRCGKTTLARAVANEAGLQLFELSAARFVSGVSGAAEETIRKLFSTAYMKAPSIVFIDDIDAISSITESLHKEIEHRLVNELMVCMDEPCGLIKPVDCDADGKSGYVLVIGATNRPDALDTALRRLFDHEIALGAPNRLDILSALTRNLKLEVGFDPAKLARCTIGFVAQDLVALAKKAGMIAVDRITGKRISKYYKEHKVGVQLEDCYMQPFYDEELENLSITMEDFLEAAKMVWPSSRLEGFSTTPNANWDDVGGLRLLKLEFERHIVKRIKFPEVYEDLRVHTPTTFFLFGSFGCGKTLIVEALANEAGANFLHIKGPRLSKYGDQIELVVHIIFNYARAHCPCILFFDELEAIIPGGAEGRLRDFVKLVIKLNRDQNLAQ